jgi:hypothetical protein
MPRRVSLQSLCALLFLTAAVSRLAAGEVSFTAGPVAVVEGQRVKISFELSAPIDVVVGIVNGQGTVVRHLGGGLLGAKAPVPFKPGLSQTLWWDRQDDRGKPVLPGKYLVRVRAGVSPKFERIIGYQPLALSDVLGLAVGSDGQLYVMNAGGLWVEAWKPTLDITVFSRELKYLRTIMPCPGDLDYKNIKGINPTVRPDGLWVPGVYHGPNRISYPSLTGRPHPVVVEVPSATKGSGQ